MKKLLSIFTTFTAVSVLAPTVVACGTGTVKIADLTSKLAADADIKAKVKEYVEASDTDAPAKKTELESKIKDVLEKELKTKLDKKEEFEKVAGLAKNSDAFEITITKDGADKAKIKVTRKDWDDKLETDADKKEKVKKTFELIEKAASEVTIAKS